MKLTQIKGNTWVLEGTALLPLYRLENGRCILLDTGLKEEREELEASLLENGLTPAGILCSHAHVDHCANNAYLQKKYGIPVALTVPEAGMCSHILNLKCYCLVISPSMAQEEMAALVHTPDELIPDEDGPLSFAGADFQIIHTPGHSSGHISTVTPDNVCYTADALLSREMMEAKLPYALAHRLADESREKLRNLQCDAYIMAHRGTCSGREIGALIDENHALIARRAEEVLSLIDRPMTISEICQAVGLHFSLLSSRPRRSLRFERNTRFFVEYLVDNGQLRIDSRDGVVWYSKSRQDGTVS